MGLFSKIKKNEVLNEETTQITEEVHNNSLNILSDSIKKNINNVSESGIHISTSLKDVHATITNLTNTSDTQVTELSNISSILDSFKGNMSI